MTWRDAILRFHRDQRGDWDLEFLGQDTISSGGSGAGGSEIALILSIVVGYITAALEGFAMVLKGIFQFIGSVLQKIGKLLHHIWENGLKHLIGGVIAWIRRASKWLELHLRPVVNFLKMLRQWWDRYYRLHILPMINLIQRIRRWLLLLRLLHVGFAQKLDNLLLKYEVRLNKYFLDVRGYLTLALNWASLATNPISLGRLVLVSVTGRRATAALVRAVTGLPVGHFFPSNARDRFPFEVAPTSSRDYTDPARNPAPSEILAPLLTDFAEGSFTGEYGPADADIDAVEHEAWGDEYVQSLLAMEAWDVDTLLLPRQPVVALEQHADILWAAGQAGAALFNAVMAQQ